MRLEDFPQAKVEKFGPMFVKILQDYCHQNEAKMDEFPEIKLQKVIKTVNLADLVRSLLCLHHVLTSDHYLGFKGLLKVGYLIK